MKKQALLTGLCIAVAMPAFAYLPGTSTLSLQAGVSGTNNDFQWSNVGPGFTDQRVANPGGAIGGQYIFYPAPALGFGFDINYSGLQERDSTDVFNDFTSASKFHPTTYLAIMKLTKPWGPVRPYFFGGLGGHTTTMSLSLTPQSGFAWSDTNTTETRSILDSTASGFAGAFGLGLDVFVAPGMFVGAEYRFTYLGTATYNVTPAGSALGFQNARTDLSLSSFLVRLGFRFGGWGGGAERGGRYQ